MLPKYPALILSGSFLSSATTSPAAPLAETNRQSTACESTHIFIARALGEPYPGRQGDLANAICQGNSSCSYQSIEYTGTRANYCSAVGTGVANGAEAISAYAAECPGAKLVLTGTVVAATLFGDVRHAPGQSYNQGTGADGSGVSVCFAIEAPPLKIYRA
ncbi:hypothetical protein FQN55_000480 [Onygenales sp. PD_40]|nr:hypothetical protein FQN55_000480 [Onygenales sp. PD_40]